METKTSNKMSGNVLGAIAGILAFFCTSYISSLWLSSDQIWNAGTSGIPRAILAIGLVLVAFCMAGLVHFLPTVRLGFAIALAGLLLIGIVMNFGAEYPLASNTTSPLALLYYLANAGRNAVSIGIIAATLANTVFLLIRQPGVRGSPPQRG